MIFERYIVIVEVVIEIVSNDMCRLRVLLWWLICGRCIIVIVIGILKNALEMFIL